MKKQDTQRAFTLIELLVVISIIALLIAILLPALGAARASARNSDCLGRMRSVAVAVTAFEVENKGFLPRAHGGNPTVYENAPFFYRDAGFYWTDYLDPYMEVPEDDTKTAFYLCPDSSLDPGDNKRRLSYSAFRGLFINRDDFAANPEKQLRASDIKRPTEVIGIGDAAQNGPDGDVGPNFTGGYEGPYTDATLAEEYIDFPERLNADGLSAPDDGFHFRFRHGSNTSGNASFIDGHAEPFKIGQIQQRNFAVEY